MVANMSQWTDLALDEETNERLERWATWARSGPVILGGGSETHLKERLDQEADSDEFTRDIEITDKAVARTKADYKKWEQVIKRYYLDKQAIFEVAGNLRFTEGYTRELLKGAVGKVAHHVIILERLTPKR